MNMNNENDLTETEEQNKYGNKNQFNNSTVGGLSPGQTKSIADDVQFSNEVLQAKPQQVRKRRRVPDAEVESNRVAEEEYNRQLHEQRYKRLMHLLNRSKFYSSYIVNKISDNTGKSENKMNKRTKKKSQVTNENTPPQESGKKKTVNPQKYDIREYISGDVKKKLNSNKKKLNLSQEEIEDELIRDSENAPNADKNDVFEVPKYFNGQLRDYQIEGFQWLKVLYENGINGILADEMGLGKTIQVIALLSHLIEKKQDGPYLITAPLSTIPNWMLEFEKFAPKLPVFVLHGAPSERMMVKKKALQKHYITDTYKTQPIILTTFEIPLLEKSFLTSQNWRYIIIDEGHRIKNHECLLVTLLRKCTSMNRLLLTGTPLQNNLAELWSLLNFLLPEIFDDLAVFEAWFDAKELQDDQGTKKLLKQEEETHVLSTLREILQPFMLRREKNDVCLDIPPKKEVIVYAPLTQLQHDLYKAVLDRDIQRLSKIDETPIITSDDGVRPKRKRIVRDIQNIIDNRLNREISPYNSKQDSDESMDSVPWENMTKTDKKHLSIWKQYTDITARNCEYFIRLTLQNRSAMYKKIVNHPYLVHCPLNSVGLPDITEDLVKASGKLLVLDAMLAKLKSEGHKVLLFSTMTMILDMIEDYLSLREYKYVRLDGGIRLNERKQNIQDFNTDPNLFLFLITTRAGGVGLNLAAADTVIVYDSDWNPQMDLQAMARCHRIGQTRPVVIYKLCTKGTIDEAIINRAEAKRVLEKMVISKDTKLKISHNAEALFELRRLLESKECQVVESENKVFTEAELNKLLDRSDLIQSA